MDTTIVLPVGTLVCPDVEGSAGHRCFEEGGRCPNVDKNGRVDQLQSFRGWQRDFETPHPCTRTVAARDEWARCGTRPAVIKGVHPFEWIIRNSPRSFVPTKSSRHQSDQLKKWRPPTRCRYLLRELSRTRCAYSFHDPLYLRGGLTSDRRERFRSESWWITLREASPKMTARDLSVRFSS